MQRQILIAIFVSALVAIPTTFASLTFYVGSLSGALNEPGFWHFYLKAFVWLFIAGFAASTVTLLTIGRKK